MKVIQYYQSALQNLSGRTKKVIVNIGGLFVLKGVNALIGFLIVPLTLSCIGKSEYGIWLAISSVFNWFSLLDIGFGNGLRNKLTEAVAKEDYPQARILVSTTYFSVGVIFVSLYILFAIANFFIPWNSVVNSELIPLKELTLITGVVFFGFCIRFIADLIGTVALAMQDAFYQQLIGVGGRIVALILIFFLSVTKNGSLFYLSVALTFIPVVVSVLFSVYFFARPYKKIRPSVKLVRLKEIKHILNFGLKFFFIQIAVIIFYQSNNIIIIQLFGPNEVTSYNVAFQYFGIISVLFVSILTPYWSSITDAYVKHEYEWIKNSVAKLKKLWLGVVVLAVVLYVCSGFLIGWWLGNKVTVQTDLLVLTGVFFVLNAYLGIYSTFLNGTSRVFLQFIISVGYAIFHIPVSIALCKWVGITGILYSTVVYSFVSIFIYEKQYRLLLADKATGIWNR